MSFEYLENNLHYELSNYFQVDIESDDEAFEELVRDCFLEVDAKVLRDVQNNSGSCAAIALYDYKGTMVSDTLTGLNFSKYPEHMKSVVSIRNISEVSSIIWEAF